MLSSNTVPYVRHLLYVAKSEAVTAAGTLTDFASDLNVRNNCYCDDYKVLFGDNNNIIIDNIINAIDMINAFDIINFIDIINVIDIIHVGIIAIIINTSIYDVLISCLKNFTFHNAYLHCYYLI